MSKTSYGGYICRCYHHIVSHEIGLRCIHAISRYINVIASPLGLLSVRLIFQEVSTSLCLHSRLLNSQSWRARLLRHCSRKVQRKSSKNHLYLAPAWLTLGAHEFRDARSCANPARLECGCLTDSLAAATPFTPPAISETVNPFFPPRAAACCCSCGGGPPGAPPTVQPLGGLNLRSTAPG